MAPIGSRIRARRIDLGLRQVELSRRIGISAAYLNLIEHNRRPIAGKRMADLARELDTDVQVLTGAAFAPLTGGLRDVAARSRGATADPASAEDLATKFPDWAALMIAQDRRIIGLERAVDNLSDRLANDPWLSGALHDILSSVTAIHSASGILVDDPGIEPDWQARFLRNLHEDSQRLADSAKGLVGYLETGDGLERGLASPQEELETWLSTRDWHLCEAETGGDPELPAGLSSGALALARAHVAQYQRDAETLPLAVLRAGLAASDGDTAFDPGALVALAGGDLLCLFRRLASLPEGVAGRPVGLAVCDGSGALTLRKPIEGLAMPHPGVTCPLWPLYTALSRPMTPIRQRIAPPGRDAQCFATFAVSVPDLTGGFDRPPVTTAAMLILPDDTPGPALGVGPYCRICPRNACPARREPSILAATGLG